MTEFNPIQSQMHYSKKYDYIVEQVKQDDVLVLDKSRFNSNNHWVNDEAPSDYHIQIQNGYTSKWIDLFRSSYKKITLNNPMHIAWMKEANKVCKQTGKFSNLYEEDLVQMIGELLTNSDISNIFDGTGYFVRSENVSLKTGMYGLEPLYTLRQIIESIVSCNSRHTPIYSDTTHIDLFLLPWKKFAHSDEFRVFVCENKITAISQQCLHERLIKPEDMEKIVEKMDVLVEYFYSDIINKIDWMNSYTFDFAFEDGDTSKPYFIEPNSFGKEYAAGSALFHWIHDEDILYGRKYSKSQKIYFRYTI